MPDISSQSQSTVRLIEEPGSSPPVSRTIPETNQDTQERAELADELEAMLDAAVEAEEADGVVIANSSDDETDIDMDYLDGAESGADPGVEVEERINQNTPPSPFKVLPSNAPPLPAYPPLSITLLQFGRPPQYTHVGRHMISPVNPAQKMIAQQFLSKARIYLKQSSAGGSLFEKHWKALLLTRNQKQERLGRFQNLWLPHRPK